MRGRFTAFCGSCSNTDILKSLPILYIVVQQWKHAVECEQTWEHTSKATTTEPFLEDERELKERSAALVCIQSTLWKLLKHRRFEITSRPL